MMPEEESKVEIVKCYESAFETIINEINKTQKVQLVGNFKKNGNDVSVFLIEDIIIETVSDPNAQNIENSMAAPNDILKVSAVGNPDTIKKYEPYFKGKAYDFQSSV